jgi:hypothetical protein
LTVADGASLVTSGAYSFDADCNCIN